MSTNAGDSELAFDVVLRANNAKYESPKQHLAFLNGFFTVSIALFTSPLLEGIQDSMLCLKLYILANSQNSLDVYCDPLSLTVSSTIPNLEKLDFIFLMTSSLVRF